MKIGCLMTKNMGQVDIIEKNRRMTLESYNELTKEDIKEINKFWHGSVEKLPFPRCPRKNDLEI